MAYTNIDDPSAYFQTVLYTGTSGNARQVTNDGNSNLKPDLVWIKGRSNQSHNLLYDSTRGVYKQIYSDLTNSEATVTNGLQEFSTDGFKVGSYVYANENTHTFVAWQWKANGGTTSSNTDGQITSTVQANTDAGFSIITYTGQSAQRTVGHGLGVKPDMLIFKNRESTSNWYVFNKNLPNYTTYALLLNGTAAQGIYSNAMAGTEPTSTVFTVGNDVVTGNGDDHICYAFAEKQGYSKFGKYHGNGARNGVFVYTGFQPAFVMIKCTSTTLGRWTMFDNKRTIANGDMDYLVADADHVESNAGLGYTDPIDLVSNGFKIRNSDLFTNQSGATYIYMAFAENPFVTSTGVPACAR